MGLEGRRKRRARELMGHSCGRAPGAVGGRWTPSEGDCGGCWFCRMPATAAAAAGSAVRMVARPVRLGLVVKNPLPKEANIWKFLSKPHKLGMAFPFGLIEVCCCPNQSQSLNTTPSILNKMKSLPHKSQVPAFLGVNRRGRASGNRS